jgi:hypothetical protein
VVIGSTVVGAIFYSYPVKVKVTIQEAKKTHEKVEIKLYSFFNTGARRVLLANATLRLLHPRQRSGIHCIVGWVGYRDCL